MKAFITGACGFVGKHLIDYISQNKNWEIIGVKLPTETAYSNIKLYDADITDFSKIEQIIRTESPDYIFHLAAQSSVALSWKEPVSTINANINGTINILESARLNNLKSRILLVSSAEEYGKQTTQPIQESISPAPSNIYALTKMCVTTLGKIYSDCYGMDIITARPFNHIGQGQSPIFAISDFCRQTALIEKGQQKNIIKTGNLSAKRDFSDVRDIVRAYLTLIEKGEKNEVYNIGSGNATSIEEVLNIILSKSKTEIKREVDPERMRPSDIPEITADTTKIQPLWQPKIKLEQSIEDILEFWRNQI